MKKNKITIDKAKKINFKMLVELRNICEENNINYFLGAGTLLGAVRHKGYIPWDDDIDVFMFRNDYDKFISIFNKKKSSKYELLHYSLDDKYLFPWAKLCDKATVVLPSRFFNKKLYGVALDVFPIDELQGNTYDESKKYANKINNLYKTKYIRKYCPYTNGKSFKEIPFKYAIKKTINVFSNLFSKNSSIKLIQNIENDLRKNTGEYLSFVFDAARKEPFVLKKECFLKSKKLTFEGETFNAPYDYDKVLTDLYGDYMKLPPKNRQVREHVGDIYLKD